MNTDVVICNCQRRIIFIVSYFRINLSVWISCFVATQETVLIVIKKKTQPCQTKTNKTISNTGLSCIIFGIGVYLNNESAIIIMFPTPNHSPTLHFHASPLFVPLIPPNLIKCVNTRDTFPVSSTVHPLPSLLTINMRIISRCGGRGRGRRGEQIRN